MVEARSPGLRLLEAVSLEASPTAPSGAASAASLLRAARPIMDRIGPEGRRRITAVIACVPGPAGRSAAAGLAVSALSLGRALALHVTGTGDGALVAALHMAQAVLAGAPDGLALIVRPATGGAAARGEGALLLGARGGLACRPLPPVRVEAVRERGEAAFDLACAAALAQSLARAGLRGADVRRIEGPGLSEARAERLRLAIGLPRAPPPRPDLRVEPLEAALAAALRTPPEGAAILWACDQDGQGGGCLLQPD